MRYKFNIILFLLLLLPVFVPAKGNTAEYQRHFSTQKLDEYRKDSDFFYIKAEENQTDFYDTFGEIILKALALIFGNEVARFILSNFSYIVLAIVFIILVLYMRKMKFRGLSFKDKNTKTNEIVITESNVEETDFEELIKEAFNSKNYNLAIRYHYLKMLQTLSRAKIIKWESHKTNFDYYLEIKNNETKNNYKKLSILFDYVWYGEGNISDTDYYEIEKEFNNLKI